MLKEADKYRNVSEEEIKHLKRLIVFYKESINKESKAIYEIMNNTYNKNIKQLQK